MPISTTYAIARGIVLEPTAMHEARGRLVKVCWTEDGQRLEHTDTGFWWMRFATRSLRIAAPFPAGATVEIHWE